MIHCGYDIWIGDSDGRRLPEYNMQIEGDDGKTAACYIPSESGKRFVIHWKDYNMAHHTDLKICVDGVLNVRNVFRPGSGGSRVGVRTQSADSYNAFQFADLRTTAGPSFAEKVGTIEVRVVRVHSHSESVPFRRHHAAGVGAVHERSKKLGAHCVAVKPLDPHEGPFATFVFRYRPAALLQAQGIIPPPGPERVALEDEISGQASSRAHGRQTKVKVKHEPRSDARTNVSSRSFGEVIELSDDEERADRKPALRVERRPGGRPSIKCDPGDVIDLTLDD
ncbi:hypothetical protein BN946_scf184583.g11 [Trametes cinnabarina]|uniref:DUF7918 domain-containing protein n=1 Tax=Pycnoporus cinnabarinus TaxID=5643 RepID=A0A060SQS5_PYCCI|nr:hypothetical protein BN946_scf184583.g11 [Trametes cinnabarina]